MAPFLLHYCMRLREHIEPIETWLMSERYLGDECYKPGKKYGLKKYWYDKIVEYFKGSKREVIFSGSSRAGKSYAYCIIILRYIYELYCIVDFPTLFGLSPTTLPKIIFFSFSKDKAASTGIDRLIRMIDSIPWFQEPGHRRRGVDSYVSFSWIEIFSGTNVGHAIGEDMLGAVIDEANIRHTAKAEQVAEAEKLYTEISMRSAITYSWKGVWKGFAGIISTAGSVTDFVDSKISEAKAKGSSIFIAEASVYDVDPDKFSSEHFDVFPGNSDVHAFVVDTPGAEITAEIADLGLTFEQFCNEHQEDMIHPPVDLKHFYLEDIQYALSNLSGITQGTASSLFKKKSDLDKVFNHSLAIPTVEYCPDLGIYDAFNALEFIDENQAFSAYHGEKVYTHNDISKNFDYSGTSHLYLDEETHKIKSLLTMDCFYDYKKPENEISQEYIFFITKALRDLGARYGQITADQYASVYYLQQCKLLFGNKIVNHLSVDDTPAAYLTVLNYAKQGMYDIPYLPKLEKELSELVYNQFSGKVDHPFNRDPKLSVKVPHDRYGIVSGFYGKDIADGFAGASFLIRTLEKVDFSESIIEKKMENYRKNTDQEEDPFEDDGFYTDLADGFSDEGDLEEDIDKFIQIDRL